MPDYGHELEFGYFLLTGLVLEQGFLAFVLWMPPDPESLRLFRGEVAPAVRERVAAMRRAGST